MNRTCLHCLNEFKANSHRQKYCSSTCVEEARAHPRFTKPIITKAYSKLSEGERLSVRQAADKMKIMPKMGDIMSLSIVAHLGAWLEENA